MFSIIWEMKSYKNTFMLPFILTYNGCLFYCLLFLPRHSSYHALSLHFRLEDLPLLFLYDRSSSSVFSWIVYIEYLNFSFIIEKGSFAEYRNPWLTFLFFLIHFSCHPLLSGFCEKVTIWYYWRFLCMILVFLALRLSCLVLCPVWLWCDGCGSLWAYLKFVEILGPVGHVFHHIWEILGFFSDIICAPISSPLFVQLPFYTYVYMVYAQWCPIVLQVSLWFFFFFFIFCFCSSFWKLSIDLS